MTTRQNYIDARKAHRARLSAKLARSLPRPIAPRLPQRKARPVAQRMLRQLDAIARFRKSRRFTPSMAAELDERERLSRAQLAELL